MKNPNGYGSVVKLSGNRRRPFGVRKTIGWNEKKQPIYEWIGYCKTREEGNILLAEYNKSPWDIDTSKTTLEGLWELFCKKKMPNLSKSSNGCLQTGYNYCASIKTMKYKDIKSYHMQDIINNCERSHSTQNKIKTLFYHLDRFALELDIINKSYSELVTVDSAPETSRVPFTDAEVNLLWENKDKPWVDSVLFLLYTGLRVGEMMSLKSTNVDLNQETIIGGSKTKAGKNRILPIHSKIFGIVSARLGEEYLFSNNKKKLSPRTYYRFWDAIMAELKMAHTPHECRHTFRSRLDSAGANKVCIDLMMGHKSNQIGERVYTHKTIEELKEAIELVTS